MIVITGATGGLGSQIVNRLLAHVPAERIVASARDPAKAAALEVKGVAVRAGDFAHPDTLRMAFDGADQVLVVSPDKLGDEGRRLSRNAIRAARAAGARRILYTSHMGTHAGSPFSDHAAIEDFLREEGTPFTSLRHGFYAESALHLIGRGFAAGEIIAPEDGPVSWTTRADLAEADAIILANEGSFDGITPAFTASEALTMADLATIASDLTGRKIKRVVLPDDKWLEAKVSQGAPRPMAELLLEMYRSARQGDFALVDPTLETLLGRRPTTMHDVLSGLLKPQG